MNTIPYTSYKGTLNTSPRNAGLKDDQHKKNIFTNRNYNILANETSAPHPDFIAWIA
jgi:hypothetical protein